ncbi:hypothetical protein M8542_32375 [Amycolatopsis sp. OK19-0408]|uniref:Uncharacterized protein n=1 Tax=Amycolatopsis iheyensis TaxID=2945988 RepID=A0A9X2NJ94_9PSEU|nr:hypothetical protein [Amycolatopsis iheyensis]MCR6487534.1 hypothetical protein [Amycolatopsis iheyensis]
MTTWTDVINFVRTRYEVLEESDGWLRFRLSGPRERTQQVAVHHLPEHDGGAWIEISSPVGRADEIDLRHLLELAGQSAVGGAGVVDGVALLKHTVPLEDLSIEHEFERPLRSVVARADALEEALTKSDEF